MRSPATRRDAVERSRDADEYALRPIQEASRTARPPRIAPTTCHQDQFKSIPLIELEQKEQNEDGERTSEDVLSGAVVGNEMRNTPPDEPPFYWWGFVPRGVRNVRYEVGHPPRLYRYSTPFISRFTTLPPLTGT